MKTTFCIKVVLVLQGGQVCVVAGFGAWVGPSSRGLVMGLWQSNAFVGNIIGRQLAGDFLEYGWGNSFILLSLILGLLIENIMFLGRCFFYLGIIGIIT